MTSLFLIYGSCAPGITSDLRPPINVDNIKKNVNLSDSILEGAVILQLFYMRIDMSIYKKKTRSKSDLCTERDIQKNTKTKI